MIKFFKFKIAAFVLMVSVLISGCGIFLMGIDNMQRAIFSKPKKIIGKITDPIRDDVLLSALWVGHSTVLLQMDDKVILLDPVFDDVIASVMLRYQEAGLDIESIPKLDLILVSHAHMDHMSLSSIGDLDKSFKGAKLIVPRGAEEYLPNYRNLDMVRMETGNSYAKNFIGETKDFDGVKVTTVYALHYGGRYGFDSYLWNSPGCTGYIIEYKGMTVFYPGDTEYEKVAFKKIGDMFDIDIALIPIGPCRDCEQLNNFSHVTSYGALLMLDDLKADYMIPVHYGAIQYRNDPKTPVKVLKKLIEEEHLLRSGSEDKPSYKDRTIILNEGEQWVFEYKNN